MWDRWRSAIHHHWVIKIKTDSGEEERYHDEPETFPGSVKFADYAQQQLKELYLPQVPFDRKNDLADLWIAMEDDRRVWYRDLEAAASPGSDEYVQALTEWGRISRGVFEPKEIRETWTELHETTPSGAPIQGQYHLKISFEWNGAPQTIEFDTPDEWINLEALEAVNKFIRNSGTQLYVYVSFDQCAYIVSLSAQEKLALENERGWKFAGLTWVG